MTFAPLMSEWVHSAAPPPGGAVLVSSSNCSIAVFELDGELVALDDRCLHRGGSLSQGVVRNGIVTCPQHWWRYDLRTGERVGAPWLRLKRYPVERDQSGIRVNVPDPSPETPIRQQLLDHAREWERDR